MTPEKVTYRHSLSVVINTRNEEKTLSRAIASVRGLADEIIVIDMESSDGTPETAKKLGAKVFKHTKLNYVEPARNFGISKVTSNWVLILDPDEEIPSTLSKKIKEVTNTDNADYYRLPRKNIVFGKWLKYSRWWPDYNIRLFRKGFVTWNEMIHTVPLTQGQGADIEDKESLAIVHHHYETIDQYIDRMNRYTTVQAILKVKEGYEFSFRDLMSAPVNEFLSRYFAGSGYKDGLHGLAVSLLQAFSELVLYLKVWQAYKFKEQEITMSEIVSQMATKEKDLHFWQNDALYKETGKLQFRIKKKLKI